MADRRMVNMVWQVIWQSAEARHTEEIFVPLNLYREADLLPQSLRQALGDWREGQKVSLDFAPGEAGTPFAPERILTFAHGQFYAGRLKPRFGRFYPRGWLTGYSGNPLPFRCVGLTPEEFQADFNHPFSPYGFRLAAAITGVEVRRAETGGSCLDWLDLATSGPGMQVRWQGRPTDFFADNPFGRRDISADQRFYDQPRLVSHVDVRAQEIIQGLYGRLLTPDMAVLDLMSSWQSHLPRGWRLRSLIGLGLNEAELQANPQLSGHVLHDLNREPRLPLSDAAFDAVICNLSVEYLIRPFEVFAECARVLKPGGLLVQVFSDRWFPPKVIKVWTELSEFERQGLVLEYFLRDGHFVDLETFSSRGWPRPPEDRHAGKVRHADPVFAVWGRKQARV